MSRSHRPDHEIPQELQPPPTPAHEAADLFGIVPGQLVELRDGQQVVVLSLVSAGIDAEAHATATVVRVRWPRSGPLPLGVSLTLLSTDDLAQGPLPNLLAAFRATHPDVELEITMGMTSKLYEGIEDGSLDLIVGKRREGGRRALSTNRRAAPPPACVARRWESVPVAVLGLAIRPAVSDGAARQAQLPSSRRS